MYIYQCQVESYSESYGKKVNKTHYDKFYFMQNSYVCAPWYNIKFCCKCCTFLSGFFYTFF